MNALEPLDLPDYVIQDLQDGDWDAVASLLDIYDRDGYTGDMLRDSSSRWMVGDPRLRLVVRDSEGKIVAYVRSLRRGSDPPGKFTVVASVHPDHTGRGLGQRLVVRGEAFALENGALFVDCYIKEQLSRSLAFAELAGYVRIQRLFESTLQLIDADLEPFIRRRLELEQEGYRFFSLLDAGDTDENRHRLFELDLTTDVDTPGSENWGRRSYEQYCRDEFQSFGFAAEGVHVAALGEEWVGMNSVRRAPADGKMWTDYSGVLREHRQRGLGSVLKALGIAYAKSTGAKTLSTHNDERNVPMLKVNSKFGFVPEPGLLIYRKRFDLN
jgi:mycothiol synthase